MTFEVLEVKSELAQAVRNCSNMVDGGLFGTRECHSVLCDCGWRVQEDVSCQGKYRRLLDWPAFIDSVVYLVRADIAKAFAQGWHA
jgi:hypothetical protein